MKMLTRISLLSALVSVVIHGYLTLHYYPLKFAAAAGPSMCNIGGKFNCDAVAASSYSAIFGIPVSIWAGTLNFILFGMILLAWLEWSNYPERLRRWAVLLAGAGAAGSLVMAFMSLNLGAFCLFCMGLWVLSWITFVCMSRTLSEPFFMHIRRDLPNMWAEGQSILGAFVAIPVISYLVHQGFLQNFGAGELDRLVRTWATEWQANPEYPMDVAPLISHGPERDKASLVVSEYADFRCSHCKHASNSLGAFSAAHPDVRFEYYAYPLDGECNSKIPQKLSISCQLAYATLCAEKQGKGWQMHDAIYANQEKINSFTGPTDSQDVVNSEAKKIGLDLNALQACMKEPGTQDIIRSQAKQGELAGVQGTPTIFANRKLLINGQLLPLLEEVRNRALKK